MRGGRSRAAQRPSSGGEIRRPRSSISTFAQVASSTRRRRRSAAAARRRPRRVTRRAVDGRATCAAPVHPEARTARCRCRCGSGPRGPCSIVIVPSGTQRRPATRPSSRGRRSAETPRLGARGRRARERWPASARGGRRAAAQLAGCIRIVSKIPSAGSGRGPKSSASRSGRPDRQTLIRRRLRTDRRRDRTRLDQRLLELGLRVGVGDDAAAHPEPQVPVGASRVCGSRRSARAPRAGWRSRSRRCRPRDPWLRARRSRSATAPSARRSPSRAGSVARSSSASPTSGRSRPSTSVTRCQRPGCASAVGRRGAVHRAVFADAADVIAHQVDDHHVLGRVLGGVPQAARSDTAASAGSLGRCAGALDRAAADLPALAAQEQLRRERDDAALRACRTLPCIGDAAAHERAAHQRASPCRRTRHSSRRQMLAWKISPAAIRSRHSATACRWWAATSRVRRSGAGSPSTRVASAIAVTIVAAKRCVGEAAPQVLEPLLQLGRSARASRAPRTTRSRSAS